VILVGDYTEGRAAKSKSRALVTMCRLPGQRWHHLACFGLKSHYRADGSCEHTEAMLDRLTDYGRSVTKVTPWGSGEYAPVSEGQGEDE